MELTIDSHSIPAVQLAISVLTMDSATIQTLYLWAPMRPAVSSTPKPSLSLLVTDMEQTTWVDATMLL